MSNPMRPTSMVTQIILPRHEAGIDYGIERKLIMRMTLGLYQLDVAWTPGHKAWVSLANTEYQHGSLDMYPNSSAMRQLGETSHYISLSSFKHGKGQPRVTLATEWDIHLVTIASTCCRLFSMNLRTADFPPLHRGKSIIIDMREHR